MTTTDERYAVRLTYAGKRRSTKNTTLHAYVGEDGAERYFGKQLGGIRSIGAVVEVEAKDETGSTVYPSTGRFVARVPSDDPRLLGWVAEDAQAEGEASRASTLRKVNAVDGAEEALAALTKAAQSLTRAQRRALAVTVMERLGL